MSYQGDFTTSNTMYVYFNTFDSNDPSASVTLTGLAVTDIEIYKDGSVIQRASDAGYALLDTDGIDFDSTTGIHGFSVDLSDNTTAGFYAAGSEYVVVVSSVTVDAATINFIAATFSIERSGGALALLKGTNSLANIEDKIDIIDTNVDTINTATAGLSGAAMRGTDSAALATALATAQLDLDKVTGSDGATLATAQGLYAPAKAGDNMGTVSSVTGNVDGSVGSVTADVGITAGAVDDIWDEDLSPAHDTAGSAGKGVQDASSAGDPWSTALPGSYTSGQAGKIIGDNINATVSSRMAEASISTTGGAVDNVTLVATTTTNTDMVGTDSAYTGTPPTAAAIVNEWETQSQADPTGFHVNVKEVNGTAQTANDNGLDINTLITQIGTAGAGLSDLGGMSTAMKSEILAEVVKLLVTQMTESYASDGTAPTIAQALMLIQQSLTEFAIAGTTKTIKKLDGSTTAATETLDDGTSPTSITRAT